MANAPQGIDRFRCNDCGKLEFDWNHRADNPESHDFNGSPLQSCPAAVGDTETPPAPTPSWMQQAHYLHVVEGSFIPKSMDNALRHLRAKLPLESASWNCVDTELTILRRDLATHTRSLAALREAARNAADALQRLATPTKFAPVSDHATELEARLDYAHGALDNIRGAMRRADSSTPSSHE